VRDEAERWNHSLHYHPVILDALPAGCEHALDVGCGQGALTRRLTTLVPHVTGIDRDERSIELARAHPHAGDVDYIHADFLTSRFAAGSFDLVTAVASLHHMDAVAALKQVRDLLRPGGILAVIGLARGGSPADIALTIPAVIGTRLHLLASPRRRHRSRSTERYQSPVHWPPPVTYRDMRELAAPLLPGADYCRASVLAVLSDLVKAQLSRSRRAIPLRHRCRSLGRVVRGLGVWGRGCSRRRRRSSQERWIRCDGVATPAAIPR